MDVKICDFGNSYIRCTSPGFKDSRLPGHMFKSNTVRIQLDSSCVLTNERTGEEEEFFLITPCRTEWMYRPDVLWQVPNREYVGIFSHKDFRAGHVGVESFDHGGGDFAATRVIKDSLEAFEVTMRYHKNIRQLDSEDDVIQATINDGPLVARSEIWDDKRDIRAVIEYPIKTMNILEEKRVMQVDTGPLLFPDFTLDVERSIEKFSLAYICYNRFDIAEFILRSATSISPDNFEGPKIMEYSDIRRLPVKTTLFSVPQQ